MALLPEGLELPADAGGVRLADHVAGQVDFHQQLPVQVAQAGYHQDRPAGYDPNRFPDAAGAVDLVIIPDDPALQVGGHRQRQAGAVAVDRLEHNPVPGAGAAVGGLGHGVLGIAEGNRPGGERERG